MDRQHYTAIIINQDGNQALFDNPNVITNLRQQLHAASTSESSARWEGREQKRLRPDQAGIKGTLYQCMSLCENCQWTEESIVGPIQSVCSSVLDSLRLHTICYDLSLCRHLVYMHM